MSVSMKEAAAVWKQIGANAIREWACEEYNQVETDWCDSYLGHRGRHKGRFTGIRWGRVG